MKNRWNGCTVNFLGDSITEGLGMDCQEDIYLNIVSKNLGFAEARNYGISATRFASQSDDEGNSFSKRFTGMEDADLIVVFGGTNDYGHGTAPIGTFADRTTETFYGACHVIMEGLINKYTTKTIVIMTPLHRENEISPNSATGERLEKYVSIIKEVAEYYSLPLLNLWTMGGIQPCVKTNRDQYCPDGLHPNAAGHVLIAKRLEEFLKNI